MAIYLISQNDRLTFCKYNISLLIKRLTITNPLVLFSCVLNTSFVSKPFQEILSPFLLVPALHEDIPAGLALLSSLTFLLYLNSQKFIYKFVWGNIRSITLSLYLLIFFVSDFYVLIFSYDSINGINLKVFVRVNILEM